HRAIGGVAGTNPQKRMGGQSAQLELCGHLHGLCRHHPLCRRHQDLNYRHAFHAGNFADVVKHTILTRILAYLMKKDAAFRVIDTHAGVGLYDLFGNEAERTGEWQEGIARVIDADLPAPVSALLAPYLDAVRARNPNGKLRYYPGSPFITRHMLRKQDRLMALELHATDAWALKKNFADDFQVRVTNLDGWA